MSDILKLKKSNCKNCYKCIRHCPVKSIRFSGNQAHIVNDECILCGHCFVVCPQNAKETVDFSESVKLLLQNGERVIAGIAPSFLAYYEGSSIEAVRAALKALGFYDVEETAIGATIVKREYDRMLEEESSDIIITSCCHSVNLLIGKYYPELMKYLAPVVSPMRAHCLDVKRRFPDARTVFIGPCLSKKDECDDVVNFVLTFDELDKMLKEAGISIEKDIAYKKESRARLFPTVGGILKSMECRNKNYTYLTVDGAENCRQALEDISNGLEGKYFIEMSACAGSCIGGPVMEKYSNSPVRHFNCVISAAGDEDFRVEQLPIEDLHKNRPYIGCVKQRASDSRIAEVLRKMGKTKPSDELNCGACGYDTCRKKAQAVIDGKAEITMCLPYLMDKSERFSNTILNNTPNGILVVNEDLEVQQVNKAAMKLLNIQSHSDVLGEMVIRIADPTPFLDVLSGERSVTNERSYFAEYDKYIEQTIVRDRSNGTLIDIMRDVTEEENERQSRLEICRKTADTADKVVEKQMRIVQEIASLLGETAAETKIALTKLKEATAAQGRDD